jgi:hypothetical protein
MPAEEFMDDDALRESVRSLANDQLPSLTLQVRESNERAIQARRLTYWHTAIAVAMCVLMVVVVVMAVQNRQTAVEAKKTGDTIEDCVVTSGQCAKRNAASTAIFLDTMAWRSERERLKTEVPIAEAKGDTQGAEMRHKRLLELDQQITAADQQLAAIRDQKTKL